MQYFIKSRDIVFNYLYGKNKVGDNIELGSIFSDGLKTYLTDVGFYILFRDTQFRYYDLHFSYFRYGRKEIDMIVFDNMDSLKNKTIIPHIFDDNDKIIFSDKNVLYYETNWWWSSHKEVQAFITLIAFTLWQYE